jgi:hypothetical protein
MMVVPGWRSRRPQSRSSVATRWINATASGPVAAASQTNSSWPRNVIEGAEVGPQCGLAEDDLDVPTGLVKQFLALDTLDDQ